MNDIKKLWQIKDTDLQNIDRIIKENDVSRLTAAVLSSRGYKEREIIQKYLQPDLSQLYSPFLLKDMKKAVSRIEEEVKRKGKIIIFGDYDVDGVTSTSILFDYLRNNGANVDYFIPDRFEQGYGLSLNSANSLRELAPSLVITVDNGIAASKEIQYLKEHHIDTIVTDHHECGETIPDAFAVINPKQPDCRYPFKNLAGVGVVFKLIQALCLSINNESTLAYKYLDIVSVGTIADIVPLVDENRILVKYGLEALGRTNNKGLDALCKTSGVKEINTWAVGYALAPRINAAGRLGSAGRAVELFVCNDPETAGEIAAELNQENKNRQEIEAMLLEESLRIISEDGLDKKSIIIIDGQDWHHGVIGIVASRITERVNKPCIIISFEGDTGRGSCRSIEGVNIFELLSECSDILEKYGGHELAGGLTIRKEKITEFKDRISQKVGLIIGKTKPIKKIWIDAQISMEDVSLKAASDLKLLEPFGIGNPCPSFFIERLEMDEMRLVGDGKHLKLKLRKSNTAIDAIGFRMGEMHETLSTGEFVDVVCVPEVNQYAGRKTAQLNIKDIRLSSEVSIERSYYKSLTVECRSKETVKKMPLMHLNFIKGRIEEVVGLINSGMRNLFLINTCYMQKKMAKYLETNIDQIMHEHKLFFNYVDENVAGKAKSIFIVNPHIDKIEFANYDNVILCDAFFRMDYYDTISKCCLNSKLYILFEPQDTSYNVEVLNEITPDRSQLTVIYKYLKSICINNKLEISCDLLWSNIWKSCRIDINPFILNLSMDIFQEMNLLEKISKDTAWSIEFNNGIQQKARIEDSNCFKSIQHYKEQFENVVRFLSENLNPQKFKKELTDSGFKS